MAEWLDTAFAGFDSAILRAMHVLALRAGGFFTPFLQFVSLFAWKGLGMILLGAVLLFPRRTRRCGLLILLAVLFGALVTNLILKPNVARARPYADAAGQFSEWWHCVGAATESDFSFPSGHATATTAAMTALFLSFRRRYSFPALIFAGLMGVSRLYLMVHYPTDVLAGALVGALCAVAAFFALRAVWKRLPPDSRLRALIPAEPGGKTSLQTNGAVDDGRNK